MNNSEIDLKKISEIDFNDPEFLRHMEEIKKESEELVKSANRHDPMDLLERFGIN